MPYLQLCLLLSAMFVVLPAYSQTMPRDHFHGLDRCAQCHLDGVDISKIIKTDAGCKTCHDGKTLNGFVAKLAKGDYSQDSRSHENRASDKAMYYKVSRIGDAPNKMIKIPAGKFIMGTNERQSDEGPQHTVYLKTFYIDKYEVTNAQYKKFIDATGRKSPSHFRNRTYPEGKVDHPVIFVDWYDAKAYCKWAGKRLPTDQEWEKAARGTDGRTFPWGDEFKMDGGNTPLRWQDLGQPGDTMPVGMFPKGESPYGVDDMSGNVWEWTSSWYEAYPNNTTYSENYGKRYKTLKGGSWFDCSFYNCGISAPSYNRAFFSRKVKNDTFGFRCAKGAE